MVAVYDGLMQGLNEAIEQAQGKRECRCETVTVPDIEPPYHYGPGEIKQIRATLNMTQYIFASFMGVSPKTVEAWEAGRNKPNGSACRLLTILQSEPDLAEKYRINAQ